MARIPEEEIERIKRETDLKALVESYGVKLEARGKDFFGLCPFHDDHEPSLVVTPEKNLWNCLGACRSGGTVIDWIMKMENVSFRHAVEKLRGGRPQTAGRRPEDKEKAHEEKPFPAELETGALLRRVTEFYHETLKESPEALSYLEKRKLIHPDLIDCFQLGYANRTLGYLLPDKQLKAGREIRERFQEIGIMRESGHEHFSGSLVIPILDGAGNVTEMYGRKVGERLRKGTPLHLYLPGQHKGVFNLAAFSAFKEIILCEALIDALTFWCHGFLNVTSSYGVNGFTPDHLEAFKKYGIEKIYIAYDNDEAGNRAALDLAEKLSAEGFPCFRLVFPAGLDVNDCAVKASDPERVFAELLNRAERLGPEKMFVSHPAPRVTEETPAPAAPAGLPVQASSDELIFTPGLHRWRIRGLDKNTGTELLKVNVQVFAGEKFHVDTLDLYSSRQRCAFLKEAGRELEDNEETLKKELGGILLKLEELQEQRLREKLEPKKREIKLNEDEREAALSFLKSPDLLDKILADFEACGVVGEETNKLVGYLAAVSRKLDNPLAVIIQSSSAAGKTWLMESVLSLMPEEERVKYSAMTGQSLFYLGETDLKHKILAIVEEEGAERASYALKLLQSEGELSIASTGKDPSTGKLVTHEYRVEGPVMIMVTTTGIDIDEELQNRCILLTVNESREQTRAIHKLQREKRTLAGLEAKLERESIWKLHRNAQRLLRPLKVVNPFAPRLTFLDDRTRTRRDHDKYLNLIDAIALLHQYQRPVKSKPMGGHAGEKQVEYIEVELSDIETANRLAAEVLGRSLDELPPQTRRLLLIIEEMAGKECREKGMMKADYRFTRRHLREYCHLGDTQLKIHLARLDDMEYILSHRGMSFQNYEYELLYDGQGKDGSPFLMQLIDVGNLGSADKKNEYDVRRSGFLPDRSGQTEERSGAGRPLVGGRSGGGRGRENAPVPPSFEPFQPLAAKTAENAYIGGNGKNRSHSRTLEAAKREGGG